MFYKKSFRDLSNEEITEKELQEKIQKGAILIDVRSNQEYREGHLKGAINIPDFEIQNEIQRKIPRKEQLIILYCQNGSRSKNASNIMKKMGYTNVFNLKNGIQNKIAYKF